MVPALEKLSGATYEDQNAVVSCGHGSHEGGIIPHRRWRPTGSNGAGLLRAEAHSIVLRITRIDWGEEGALAGFVGPIAALYDDQYVAPKMKA